MKLVVGMGSYSYAPKQSDLDLESRLTPIIKPSIEELLVLEKSVALPSMICFHGRE